MNIEYAKLPVSLGIPYSAKAVWLRIPPVKTSALGYTEPFSVRSRVDMNGCDFESQALE